ncbi:MAG TPA: hypothetical protein VEW71_06860 [Allosphingosinicella sp.]|nr:hypothetical protein [Allosphingosinicella sp.]
MIAAALQAIAAFNLACTGTMRSGPLGLALPEGEGEPFTIVYRIDLEAGRWCSGECDIVEALAAVANGEIVLRDRHDPAGSSVVRFLPGAGRFTDTQIAGNIATLRSGTCEPAAFTGFPIRVA